jgi:uncharacterized membrane protein
MKLVYLLDDTGKLIILAMAIYFGWAILLVPPAFLNFVFGAMFIGLGLYGLYLVIEKNKERERKRG